MQHRQRTLYFFITVSLLLTSLFLGGCVTAPPNNTVNVCKIFRQYPKWYWAASDSRQRWKVPINVMMAILHQESRFTADAKPPRTKLLWVIPWKRPSSAYGYTQALNETWEVYKKSAGRHGADRDEFKDAIDFVGWYVDTAHRKAGIDKRDVYTLYLAYHEGIGGYQRGTYMRKAWLRVVASKVQRRAAIYRSQLAGCEKHLNKKPWWRKW